MAELKLADRGLERAILLTFVIHGLAMVGMVTLLFPGVPGGIHSDVHERAAYVAGHPWLWRVGWLGWQSTAASDLYLSIALLRTPWIPRRPARFALAVTLIALLPDQIGQFVWSVFGPGQASLSITQKAPATYAATEGLLFQAVGGWAAGLYLIAAIGWTVALHRAGVWSTAIKRLSVVTWTIFAIAVIMLCFPRSNWTPRWLAIAGGLNALAFVFLMAWFAAVGEQVMRRTRPDTPHGRHAEWAFPRSGLYGHFINYLANSRFVRGLFEYVPALSMRSDVRDVIYVNYLAEADRLATLVPPPLQLQRLGSSGRYAMFSFLIYRHGHFAPVVFGPFKKLWRSPIQSNWRLYVRDPGTGTDGVYFLTTAISLAPYALAARLLSEGVPMHVPAAADIARGPDGCWEAHLAPGTGTSPDVRLSLQPIAHSAELPPPWPAVFGDMDQALAYCVPQDRALNVQPWYGRVTRQEIRLEIPLASCQRLAGTVDSATARSIVGDAAPVCFYVPSVRFHYVGETY